MHNHSPLLTLHIPAIHVVHLTATLIAPHYMVRELFVAMTDAIVINVKALLMDFVANSSRILSFRAYMNDICTRVVNSPIAVTISTRMASNVAELIRLIITKCANARTTGGSIRNLKHAFKIDAQCHVVTMKNAEAMNVNANMASIAMAKGDVYQYPSHWHCTKGVMPHFGIMREMTKNHSCAIQHVRVLNVQLAFDLLIHSAFATVWTTIAVLLIKAFAHWAMLFAVEMTISASAPKASISMMNEQCVFEQSIACVKKTAIVVNSVNVSI
jgi:hypothetical protein